MQSGFPVDGRPLQGWHCWNDTRASQKEIEPAKPTKVTLRLAQRLTSISRLAGYANWWGTGMRSKWDVLIGSKMAWQPWTFLSGLARDATKDILVSPAATHGMRSNLECIDLVIEWANELWRTTHKLAHRPKAWDLNESEYWNFSIFCCDTFHDTFDCTVEEETWRWAEICASWLNQTSSLRQYFSTWSSTKLPWRISPRYQANDVTFRTFVPDLGTPARLLDLERFKCEILMNQGSQWPTFFHKVFEQTPLVPIFKQGIDVVWAVLGRAAKGDTHMQNVTCAWWHSSPLEERKMSSTVEIPRIAQIEEIDRRKCNALPPLQQPQLVGTPFSLGRSRFQNFNRANRTLWFLVVGLHVTQINPSQWYMVSVHFKTPGSAFSCVQTSSA